MYSGMSGFQSSLPMPTSKMAASKALVEALRANHALQLPVGLGCSTTGVACGSKRHTPLSPRASTMGRAGKYNFPPATAHSISSAPNWASPVLEIARPTCRTSNFQVGQANRVPLLFQ